VEHRLPLTGLARPQASAVGPSFALLVLMLFFMIHASSNTHAKQVQTSLRVSCV
jgi:hypothetical protein